MAEVRTTGSVHWELCYPNMYGIYPKDALCSVQLLLLRRVQAASIRYPRIMHHARHPSIHPQSNRIDFISLSSSLPPCPKDRLGCCSNCSAGPCSPQQPCLRVLRLACASHVSSHARCNLAARVSDCVLVGVGCSRLVELAIGLTLWLWGLTALVWCRHCYFLCVC